MKIVKYIFLIITALFLGCSEDFITKTNNDNMGEDFFNGGAGNAEKMVNAAYAPLQKNGLYCRTASQLAQTRSDEARITKNTPKMEEDGVAMGTYNENANSKLAEMIWRQAYNGIFQSNVAIDNITNNSNIPDEKKLQFLGEVYFLRAFYYFHLTMYFGEIIPEQTNSGESVPSPFKTDTDVWEMMVADLKQAQKNFETIGFTNAKSVGDNLGRANLGSATGLLGKVYLYYAQMKKSNSTEMLNLAKAEFKKIVDQKVGSYSLMPNYMDNFRNNMEYNSESLFEVGFLDYGTKVWEIDQDNDGGAETNRIAKNATMGDAVGEMWWNEAPTARILNEYETNNGVKDYRCYYTLWQPGGAYFNDCKLENEAVKDYVVHYENVFTDLTNTTTKWGTEYGDYRFYGWRKYGFDYNFWVKDNTDKVNKVGSDINYRVIRYADVLLMLAECEYYTGGDPKPLINQVRARANNMIADANQSAWGNSSLPYLNRQGTLPTAENSKYASNLEAAIQHERMVELACEATRYYDIIRWNKAGLLIDLRKNGFPKANIHDVIIDPAFTGNFLLPIPQEELNRNPNIKQNSSN